MPIQTGTPLTRNFSNANPDGDVVGQSATDLISVYGVPAVTQAANSAAVTTGVAGSVTTITPTLTAYGFTTAQAAALLTAVNNLNTVVNLSLAQNGAIRQALVNFGIIAGP